MNTRTVTPHVEPAAAPNTATTGAQGVALRASVSAVFEQTSSSARAVTDQATGPVRAVNQLDRLTSKIKELPEAAAAAGPRGRADLGHGVDGLRSRGGQHRAEHPRHGFEDASRPAPRVEAVSGASLSTARAAVAPPRPASAVTAAQPEREGPATDEPRRTISPPAAPTSASASASGVTPGAAHLPAAEDPDLRAVIVCSAHATDDALPAGPAGSTDSSPD
ncbi:hypothetical protein [Microbacterium sp.]|uniref:hypothetical protein n=1 Tax=Microbacterium sp. TaxID=51671 RepID=UPI0028114A0A|nr:hypothetical protein [Microbacterium sp.]